MNRFKITTCFILSLITSRVLAQDVIVKKDGSTILAKVVTVGENEVEYKKYNNQGGPTYKISVLNILSINYESGDKDTFESVAPNHTSNTGAGSNFSEAIKRKNVEKVNQINSITPKWITSQEDKEAKGVCNVFRAKDGSMFEDDNLRIDFDLKEAGFDKTKGFQLLDYSKPDIAKHEFAVKMWQNEAIAIKLTNKTTQTLYVDLGNTFLVKNGEAKPYYIPSSTTVTKGSTTGASVNLGSVAGAIGIGGALGTLAGGINVGGANTNTVSKVEYAQRVVAIPPMSSKSLEGKFLFDAESNVFPYFQIKNRSNSSQWVFDAYSLLVGLKVGDIIDWMPENSPIVIDFYVSYSKDEMCTNLSSIYWGIYTSKTYGLQTKMKWSMTDYIIDDLEGIKQVPLKVLLPNKPNSKKGINVSSLNITRNGK